MDSQATIPSLFAQQANRLNKKPLFLSKQNGAYQPISWSDAYESIQCLSAFFLQSGVSPKDRVLILSENRPEWAVADIAIQTVGAWTVPIYPSLLAEEILAICQDCQPVICVVSTPAQAEKIIQLMPRVPSIQSLIIMDSFPAGTQRALSWTDALKQGKQLLPKQQQAITIRQSQLRADETATLIYTSGTTGEPKGVMLSHRNFLSNVEACLSFIPISESDTHLSFLPLCHVFERMAGWYLMFTAGACVAFAENMDAIPQNMLEIRPTVMLGVPRFFEKLYNRIQAGIQQAPAPRRQMAQWALAVGQAATERKASGKSLPWLLSLKLSIASHLVFKKLKAKLGGRLRFFVSGSAPLSKTIGEFFYSLGVTIIEGYGLTETSPVIAANRLEHPVFGSVGLPAPGVDVSIAEDGEILARGPLVMQGYYNKPEATAGAIIDGWFHTGDIGHLDADGRLFITDRKKDLIKTSGGKFVAPQKLEGLFAADPCISQVFVYGDKQPYCVALVVPNAQQLLRYAKENSIPGNTVKELVEQPAVQAWYLSRIQAKQNQLSGYEQVKKIALLDQEFSQAAGELTPTLKAKRANIAARYEAVLRRLYEQPSP